VYKVKFPVTEAGKEIRVPTTMDLTQFPTVGNFPQQGTNCKESPLMNWVAEWSKVKKGVRCSSRVRTLAGLFLEKPIPSDIDFSPN
jgi:hypothetical protein